MQKTIKKLRRTSNGDIKTIIYLQMMLLSIKQDCTLFFEGVEDTIEDELALELDESSDLIKETIDFLIKQGLIEIREDDEYFLPEAKESTGSESYSAERVRKFREKKKMLQCNANVTSRNIDEIPCNEEKEIKIKKEIKDKDTFTYVPDELLNQSIHEFLEFRKKIKSPMTEKAILLLISNLEKLTPDNDERIEILNQSIMNGWKGIFPLKQTHAGKEGGGIGKVYNNGHGKVLTGTEIMDQCRREAEERGETFELPDLDGPFK